MNVPGLGIPLGGFGAGSFMINQAGTFGPWNFGGQSGTSWEMRILPQAAFHVRERIGTGAAAVRTLATDGPTNTGSNGVVRQRSWGSPLPAWNRLRAGDGDYAALYPFGFMNYRPFKTDVSMRFYSPIVAKEDRRTSMPLAYFDVRIANHTADKAQVSVMFTMPNAPAHVAGTRADLSATAPDSVRTGLSSQFRSANGIQAVTLSADDPSNTLDSAKSEWTIAASPAAGQKVSYVTSWNGEGDGADIYDAFSSTGSLPNANLDRSATAGAISVSASLAPGEVTTVPFALAWDFPQVTFANDQTVWMKRYTDFYGAKTTESNDYVAGSYPFHQSFAIARDALAGRQAALDAVNRWWQPIASDPAYPLEQRRAALNELSMLAVNNSFWEGGLVRNTVVPTGFAQAGPGQHLGAGNPDGHLFGVQDTGAGGTSGMGGTTDIQAYNYRAYYTLFPNVFRDQLLADIETVKLHPSHNAQDIYANSASGSPFITWGNGSDATIQGGTDSRPPNPGQTEWGDSPSKFILQWYAFAKLNNDPELLRAAWPAIKDEIAYLRGLVPAGTHLPVDSGLFTNIYNVIPQEGTGLYNSQLYLLSLTIASTTGEQLGVDTAYVDEVKSELAAAKSQFELTFWDPVTQHYRFSTGSTYPAALFIDSFFAQYVAEDLGLPDVVDPLHRYAQLRLHQGLYRRYDSSGQMIGAPALALPVGLGSPDGQLPPEAQWVWPGTDHLAAADFVKAGGRFSDPQLKAFGLELGRSISDQIWARPDNAFAFNPPCGWSDTSTYVYDYPAYSQALAVWGLMNAIKPITVLTS
ncbi:GH116 family glycosyl-hydrolase [Pedococcus sp. 5OH_020]|uniref:GH116 family glycosyl-hydrolase n=1 Tax=Pedococcus sp. 5OH_020 TaxID=2989814 RepID=UPI0022EA092F|nr:GH116 family glycosyl-hydrolase [Pedococcus sp. 5OH_020]